MSDDMKGLTQLQRRILQWVRDREMMPSASDLCAEFPNNQRNTLLGAMDVLVRRRLVVERISGLWTTP